MKKTNLLTVVALAGALLLPQVSFAEESETIVPGASFAAINAKQTADVGAAVGTIAVGNYKLAYTFTTAIDEEFKALGSATFNGTTGNVISGWKLEQDVAGVDTVLFSGSSVDVFADGSVWAFATGKHQIAAGTYELEIFGTVYVAPSSLSSQLYVGNPIDPVVSVPEPEQLALFLLGLPLISWFARRKQAA